MLRSAIEGLKDSNANDQPNSIRTLNPILNEALSFSCLIMNINPRAAKQFREQLRAAREYALKDAEAFDGIIHVIERLGSLVLGRVAALGEYHDKLKKLAGRSELSVHQRNFHTPFSPLYRMVARARNDAMHMGASARHLTTHAIELALILEDALIMNNDSTDINANASPSCISDYMVREVMVAHLWEPVSFIRQKMLSNSFSFLPFQNKEGKWLIISDLEIAKFLQGHLQEGRNKRLAKTLAEVMDENSFKPACCHMGNESIETILEKFNGKPVLVFADERKGQIIGILTAFDLL